LKNKHCSPTIILCFKKKTFLERKKKKKLWETFVSLGCRRASFFFFLACYYFLCDEISAGKLKSGRNYKVQKDWERVHNNVALCACVLCM